MVVKNPIQKNWIASYPPKISTISCCSNINFACPRCTKGKNLLLREVTIQVFRHLGVSTIQLLELIFLGKHLIDSNLSPISFFLAVPLPFTIKNHNSKSTKSSTSFTIYLNSQNLELLTQWKVAQKYYYQILPQIPS